jgi:hypothetical protein
VAEAPVRDSNAAGCRRSSSPIFDGRPVDGWVVFGRGRRVHIDERYIRNGLLDTAAMKPIARGGYHDIRC